MCSWSSEHGSTELVCRRSFQAVAYIYVCVCVCAAGGEPKSTPRHNPFLPHRPTSPSTPAGPPPPPSCKDAPPLLRRARTFRTEHRTARRDSESVGENMHPASWVQGLCVCVWGGFSGGPPGARRGRPAWPPPSTGSPAGWGGGPPRPPSAGRSTPGRRGGGAPSK